MKKLFFLYILFPILLTAQNKNFNAGFDVSWDNIWFDSNNNQSNIFNGFLVSIPTVYNIHFTYVHNKKISFQTKLGYVLPLFENFGGIEYGISGKYQIYNDLFTTLGIINHSNEPSDKRHSGGSYNINLLFINFGIGYNLSKYVSAEVNYLHPTQSMPIYYERNKPDEIVLYSVKYIVRLSLVFGWEL